MSNEIEKVGRIGKSPVYIIKLPTGELSIMVEAIDPTPSIPMPADGKIWMNMTGKRARQLAGYLNEAANKLDYLARQSASVELTDTQTASDLPEPVPSLPDSQD